jgi:hypothetical protein
MQYGVLDENRMIDMSRNIVIFVELKSFHLIPRRTMFNKNRIFTLFHT